MEQKIEKKDRKIKRIPITRNFLVFLVFVLISTFFWFLYVLSRKQKADVNISLEYKGIPRSYIITNKLPDHITASINDIGLNELINIYIKDSIKANVDIAQRFDSNSTQFTIQQSEIQKAIASVMPSTTEIKQFYPKEINVSYERLYKRTVPVVLDNNIELSQQFTLKKPISYVPDSVTIYGPKTLIGKTNSVITENLTIKGLTESKATKIKIKKINNISVYPKNVTVRINVEQFTEKTINAPIQVLNVPKNKRLRIFPTEVQVTFNIGLSHYKQITSDDFNIIADMDSIKEDSSYICTLKESHKTPYINSVRINPSHVEYIIEDIK